MSKRLGGRHIYKVPELVDGKWIIEKTYLSDVGALYYSDTEEEAQAKLKKLLLLNMSITEEFLFEFEKDNEFFYTPIPSLEKDSGTYSISIKKMSNKETIKFIDNIDTLNEAIQKQRKISGVVTILPVEVKPESKPRKKRQNKKKLPVRKNIPLNISQQQEAYVFVKSSIFSGFSKKETLEMLQMEYPELNEKQCESLMESAQTFFKNAAADSLDIPNIIQTHIGLYEKIWRYFSEVGFTPGMNKALFQKEKLLGYHNKDTVVEFNQENNITVNKPQYNLSVLTEDETNRLNQYLSKVTVNATNK